VSDWRERYETGTTWELKLYAYLLKLGRYAILRVAHGGMFAPVLETWYRRITAPDFQMHDMKTGDYVWPESKWKQTAARFYLANNEWRTGIDVDKYHHYRAVEEATHHSVALFFTHDREGEVRLAWLKDKIDGVGRGDRMVYWSWDRLQYVASIADVEACKPADLPVTGRTLFRPPSLQLGLDLDGDA
jgi:hypothetical protein